jgi:glycosyltransferase involved in cell wall biosynthesis
MNKVSVIIPFYSNVKWLCEAVESVLKQNYNNYEIIVINDGSKEDVSGFIEKYGCLVRYFYQDNMGAAAARNLGIKKATGEYIAFLDSDDIWEMNKLSTQLSKMVEYDAKWSYTDYEFFGEGIINQYKRMNKKDEGKYDFISPYIGTPTVMIDRHFMIDNNLCFCEELEYGEDSFLWERIISISHVLYIPENLAMVRIRRNNASKRAAVQLTAYVDIYDKCISEIPNYRKRRSIIYRFAIYLCRFGIQFIDRKKMNNKSEEFKARILFVVPYILFRADRLLCKK